MSSADRNKIFIAGGVALVAIIIIGFFLLRGRRGAEPEAGAGFGAGGEEVVAEATGVPAVGVAPAPGEAEPGVAGGEEGAVVVPAGPSIGLVQMNIGPSEPTREDPFLSFDPPPRPTPPELLVALPPVNIVPGGLRPGGITTVAGPRIGNRRVAGLLFNDQAFAILEDEDGDAFVVKPGDVVDGIRITAIARNSIFLMDEDGKRWEVPLRGLGPSASMSGRSSTVSAMPSMPPA